MDPLLWEYKQSIAKRYGEYVNYKIWTDSNPPKGSLVKSQEEFDCSDQWYCDTVSGRQQVRSDLGWAKTDSTKQAQPAHCPIHLRIISTSQVGSFEGVSSNSFSTSVTWQHGLHHSQKKNNGNYGTVNNVKCKIKTAGDHPLVSALHFRATLTALPVFFWSSSLRPSWRWRIWWVSHPSQPHNVKGDWKWPKMILNNPNGLQESE